MSHSNSLLHAFWGFRSEEIEKRTEVPGTVPQNHDLMSTNRDGRIHVTAFLPLSDSAFTHDDSLALALYDYKVTLQSIDQEVASQI